MIRGVVVEGAFCLPVDQRSGVGVVDEGGLRRQGGLTYEVVHLMLTELSLRRAINWCLPGGTHHRQTET